MPLFQSESDLNLHENETACRTHDHMKSFTLRLALKQRYKRTRIRPIIPRKSFTKGISIGKTEDGFFVLLYLNHGNDTVPEMIVTVKS